MSYALEIYLEDWDVLKSSNKPAFNNTADIKDLTPRIETYKLSGEDINKLDIKINNKGGFVNNLIKKNRWIRFYDKGPDGKIKDFVFVGYISNAKWISDDTGLHVQVYASSINQRFKDDKIEFKELANVTSSEILITLLKELYGNMISYNWIATSQQTFSVYQIVDKTVQEIIEDMSKANAYAFFVDNAGNPVFDNPNNFHGETDREPLIYQPEGQLPDRITAIEGLPVKIYHPTYSWMPCIKMVPINYSGTWKSKIRRIINLVPEHGVRLTFFKETKLSPFEHLFLNANDKPLIEIEPFWNTDLSRWDFRIWFYENETFRVFICAIPALDSDTIPTEISYKIEDEGDPNHYKLYLTTPKGTFAASVPRSYWNINGTVNYDFQFSLVNGTETVKYFYLTAIQFCNPFTFKEFDNCTSMVLEDKDDIFKNKITVQGEWTTNTFKNSPNLWTQFPWQTGVASYSPLFDSAFAAVSNRTLRLKKTFLHPLSGMIFAPITAPVNEGVSHPGILQFKIRDPDGRQIKDFEINFNTQLQKSLFILNQSPKEYSPGNATRGKFYKLLTEIYPEPKYTDELKEPNVDEWVTNKTYDLGDISYHSDTVWKSLQINNKNHEPAKGTWWTEVTFSSLLPSTGIASHGNGVKYVYNGEPIVVYSSPSNLNNGSAKILKKFKCKFYSTALHPEEPKLYVARRAWYEQKFSQDYQIVEINDEGPLTIDKEFEILVKDRSEVPLNENFDIIVYETVTEGYWQPGTYADDDIVSHNGGIGGDGCYWSNWYKSNKDGNTDEPPSAKWDTETSHSFKIQLKNTNFSFIERPEFLINVNPLFLCSAFDIHNLESFLGLPIVNWTPTEWDEVHHIYTGRYIPGAKWINELGENFSKKGTLFFQDRYYPSPTSKRKILLSNLQPTGVQPYELKLNLSFLLTDLLENTKYGTIPYDFYSGFIIEPHEKNPFYMDHVNIPTGDFFCGMAIKASRIDKVLKQKIVLFGGEFKDYKNIETPYVAPVNNGYVWEDLFTLISTDNITDKILKAITIDVMYNPLALTKFQFRIVRDLTLWPGWNDQWEFSKTYALDEKVYHYDTYTFYKSLQNGNQGHTPVGGVGDLWWSIIADNHKTYSKGEQVYYKPGPFVDEHPTRYYTSKVDSNKGNKPGLVVGGSVETNVEWWNLETNFEGTEHTGEITFQEIKGGPIIFPNKWFTSGSSIDLRKVGETMRINVPRDTQIKIQACAIVIDSTGGLQLQLNKLEYWDAHPEFTKEIDLTPGFHNLEINMSGGGVTGESYIKLDNEDTKKITFDMPSTWRGNMQERFFQRISNTFRETWPDWFEWDTYLDTLLCWKNDNLSFGTAENPVNELLWGTFDDDGVETSFDARMGFLFTNALRLTAALDNGYLYWLKMKFNLNSIAKTLITLQGRHILDTLKFCNEETFDFHFALSSNGAYLMERFMDPSFIPYFKKDFIYMPLTDVEYTIDMDIVSVFDTLRWIGMSPNLNIDSIMKETDKETITATQELPDPTLFFPTIFSQIIARDDKSITQNGTRDYSTSDPIIGDSWDANKIAWFLLDYLHDPQEATVNSLRWKNLIFNSKVMINNISRGITKELLCRSYSLNFDEKGYEGTIHLSMVPPEYFLSLKNSLKEIAKYEKREKKETDETYPKLTYHILDNMSDVSTNADWTISLPSAIMNERKIVKFGKSATRITLLPSTTLILKKDNIQYDQLGDATALGLITPYGYFDWWLYTALGIERIDINIYMHKDSPPEPELLLWSSRVDNIADLNQWIDFVGSIEDAKCGYIGGHLHLEIIIYNTSASTLYCILDQISSVKSEPDIRYLPRDGSIAKSIEVK